MLWHLRKEFDRKASIRKKIKKLKDKRCQVCADGDGGGSYFRMLCTMIKMLEVKLKKLDDKTETT